MWKDREGVQRQGQKQGPRPVVSLPGARPHQPIQPQLSGSQPALGSGGQAPRPPGAPSWGGATQQRKEDRRWICAKACDGGPGVEYGAPGLVISLGVTHPSPPPHLPENSHL